MRFARLIVGYGAIVFMLPYLALTIIWLSGNPIGFHDESLVGKPGMIAANVMSFGMDLVAVGLALTFTHRWGLRVPPWLVLFPMWVATGFLAPAVVMAVLSGITFGQRAVGGMALNSCLSFVKFTGGMLIGLVTAVLLVERQAAIRSRDP